MNRVALLLTLALAACSAPAAMPPLAGAKIGGPFTLIDQNGATVTERSFPGQYRIMYFGYTFCPDVCPTDVANLARGLKAFAKVDPARAERLKLIFVSVDPARDTPAAVGEFAAAFSPKLIGLTGTEAQVAEASKMFKGFYSKGEPTKDGGYLMDHARIAYLMDPQGKPLAILPIDQTPDAVAESLAKWTS